MKQRFREAREAKSQKTVVFFLFVCHESALPESLNTLRWGVLV